MKVTMELVLIHKDPQGMCLHFEAPHRNSIIKGPADVPPQIQAMMNIPFFKNALNPAHSQSSLTLIATIEEFEQMGSPVIGDPVEISV